MIVQKNYQFKIKAKGIKKILIIDKINKVNKKLRIKKEMKITVKQKCQMVTTVQLIILRGRIMLIKTLKKAKINKMIQKT